MLLVMKFLKTSHTIVIHKKYARRVICNSISDKLLQILIQLVNEFGKLMNLAKKTGRKYKLMLMRRDVKFNRKEI